MSSDTSIDYDGKRVYCICIVLYLYIYIALLAVHTNQKRFQCERAREKRAVLREQKEALCSTVNRPKEAFVFDIAAIVSHNVKLRLVSFTVFVVGKCNSSAKLAKTAVCGLKFQTSP